MSRGDGCSPRSVFFAVLPGERLIEPPAPKPAIQRRDSGESNGSRIRSPARGSLVSTYGGDRERCPGPHEIECNVSLPIAMYSTTLFIMQTS
jgi:hypothetical protein